MFQKMMDKSVAKSPWLFHVNAGSCNGCDIEIVVVSGPVTRQTRDRVIRTIAQVPEPRVIVSIGSCPRSGNVFKGSYAIDGPLEKWVHVDVAVAGCTPKPEAIMAGLAKATEILKEKRKEMRK